MLDYTSLYFWLGMVGDVLQGRDGVNLDIDVVYCGEYGVIVPVRFIPM